MRQLISGDDEQSAMMNSRNAARLARSMCRMRGAALKVGQMLSIQDAVFPEEFQVKRFFFFFCSPCLTLSGGVRGGRGGERIYIFFRVLSEGLPPKIIKTKKNELDRVRDGADIMPRWQLEQTLEQELGPDWKDQFLDFEYAPIAAASIGQVHRAQLKKPTADGETKFVALKVQYPGVKRAIDSDLSNLQWLSEVFFSLPLLPSHQLFLQQPRIVVVVWGELLLMFSCCMGCWFGGWSVCVCVGGPEK